MLVSLLQPIGLWIRACSLLRSCLRPLQHHLENRASDFDFGSFCTKLHLDEAKNMLQKDFWNWPFLVKIGFLDSWKPHIRFVYNLVRNWGQLLWLNVLCLRQFLSCQLYIACGDFIWLGLLLAIFFSKLMSFFLLFFVIQF